MSAPSRRVALFALSLIAACGGLGRTDPVADAALESTQFVHTLTSEIARVLQAQANDLARQRADLVRQRDAAADAERPELSRQIQVLDSQIMELTSAKTLAEGNSTAWAINSSLITIYSTLGEIEERLDQLDTWSPELVDLDLMAAQQVAALRSSMQSAGTAVGVIARIDALRRTIEDINSVAATPHGRKMMAGLSVLFESMQWIAKFTPTIEPFIAQYGDAGQAMLAASARIEARLVQSAKGLFVQGRPDDGRLQAFDAQFPELADERDMLEIWPLPGVRDAYIVPQGRDQMMVIWDPARGYWHRTALSGPEVARRYAFFATFGNPNPTPDQVLGRLSDRAVGLTVAVEHAIVPPGGQTRVVVLAERLDGSEVRYLGIKLSVREELVLLGPGDPGQIEPSIVDAAPEDMAVWQAPDKEHSVFTITASLTDDEDVYQLVQPATCSVATGGSSTIRAGADPQQVEPGGDGLILYEVLDAEGNLLRPKVPVSLFADPGLGVGAGEWRSQTEARGWASYHAPRRPGVYEVRLFFPGYLDAGYIYGKNYMAAQAAVTITVPGVPEPEPIVAGRTTQQPQDEPNPLGNTPVPVPVPQPDVPAPQALNLIPGVYDGSKSQQDAHNKYVVTLSGDPYAGISWQLETWSYGTFVGDSSWSGTVVPTGEVFQGEPVLGGYFQIARYSHQSWAEVRVCHDRDGNWVASELDIWWRGKPSAPRDSAVFDASRTFLKKRQ